MISANGPHLVKSQWATAGLAMPRCLLLGGSFTLVCDVRLNVVSFCR